ncbi:TSUP family transporter [Georgenia sp. SUBG003]|uniref:TSUP family transporter n=1 Tax=Georgenia sp. SUBG003 TaxID=1497974 RepID=UPI0004DA9DCB|nr:hypothetical protein DA06_04745 [Georgenia sp. SUBG003]
MTAALVLAVLVGAVMQRVTGMGFALVAAPFVILALGPSAGVLVIAALGVLAALVVLGRVRADVDWPTLGRLLPGALLGIAAGTAAAAVLDAAWAQVAAGALIIAGLIGSAVVVRARTLPRSLVVVSATGLASGAMGVVAGVSGPAMAVLAVLTRWDTVRFAATMQPYFVLTGLFTVAARLLVEPGVGGRLGVVTWALIAAALGAGVALGELVAKRLSAAAAHRLVVVLAAAGALATIADGVARLLR